MCDMGVYIDTVFLSNSIVKVEVNTSFGVGYQSYYCIVQQPLLSSSVWGSRVFFFGGGLFVRGTHHLFVIISCTTHRVIQHLVVSSIEYIS